MPDWKNPFADPELTYKGKTARQRGEELLAEDARRDLEARLAAARAARKPTPPATEPQPDTSSGNPPPSIIIPPLIVTPGSLVIQELPDRYRLLNVDYIGEKWNFDWLKQRLAGGNKTQDTWISETKNEEIRLPNSMMVYATVAALYHHRDHIDPGQKRLVEKVVEEIFKPDITKNYSYTSSRLAYQPQGTDRVIHNLGYTDQHTIDEDIVGPDAWVNINSRLEKPISAILGTTNLAEVEQVYTWLSGQKPYLYRLNNKPQQELLRAVVFGLVDNDRFNINADNYFNNLRPARGVVAQKISGGP